MSQLIPINRPQQLLAAGIPFDTEDKARWAERQARANHNGLRGAFIRIGRRVYIDVPKFHELVKQAGGR
jgi:hypothetical protein